MSKFMISCDEATGLSDKNQYKEASFMERLKLGFHLLMCKSCTIYNEQNIVLTKVINDKYNIESKANENLSFDEKTVIKEKIDTNL